MIALGAQIARHRPTGRLRSHDMWTTIQLIQVNAVPGFWRSDRIDDRESASAGQFAERRWRIDMKSAIGSAAIVIALTLPSVADAHSLRIQCKKLDADNVVCRSLFSDGEVARNLPIQLIGENNDRVLASGKTDTEGKYAFKAPAAEYNVVMEANKGHVASISSEDIW